MLIFPVSATGRQERTPAMGYAAAFIAGSRPSISADTSLRRSATPLIRVTRTVLPQDRGSQTTETRFLSTSPTLQSPLCVPKIRFCNIDGEGRQGQVVRRRRRG